MWLECLYLSKLTDGTLKTYAFHSENSALRKKRGPWGKAWKRFCQLISTDYLWVVQFLGILPYSDCILFFFFFFFLTVFFILWRKLVKMKLQNSFFSRIQLRKPGLIKYFFLRILTPKEQNILKRKLKVNSYVLKVKI